MRLSVCLFVGELNAADSPPARTALVRAVDLDLNEAQEVELADRTRVRVKLLTVDETRDAMRDAVRQARVKVELNGQSLVLTSATYHLPVKFAGVQIDCPITKGYVGNSSEGNAWGLLKDARLRLWPAGSPWIEPGTFVYPLKQRWFASHTQMANEPTFVDGGEAPGNKKIYYHYGLDSGGAEGMVDVMAAAAGRVISAGKEILPGYEDSPAKPRYDVVYLARRAWLVSSLQPSADHRSGRAARRGDQLWDKRSACWARKAGAEAGRICTSTSRAASRPGCGAFRKATRFFGKRTNENTRPKSLPWPGRITLFSRAKKSFSTVQNRGALAGKIARYDWTFTDGTTASGPTVERTYSESGEYSEILKVTDARGEVDYDFAVVLVIDKSAPDRLPPTIHPAFAPTMNIRAGDPVTFKVRSFRTTSGNETWDFGDGSEKVTVKSDGNVELARQGRLRGDATSLCQAGPLPRARRANQ